MYINSRSALECCKSEEAITSAIPAVDNLTLLSRKADTMLEPVMNVLGSQRIVLASSSPRRQELLQNMGLKFQVIPSRYEENLNPDDFSSPADYAVATAANKVHEVRERLKAEEFDLIIGADTVVSKENRVYGKPKNEEEALDMLKTLNGAGHEVYSGVCLANGSKSVTFSECTRVFFGSFSEETLRAYVKTGDPLDKAGAYGIQALGGSLVRRIEGDYFNVVGLPLHSFCSHLLKFYAGNPNFASL